MAATRWARRTCTRNGSNQKGGLGAAQRPPGVQPHVDRGSKRRLLRPPREDMSYRTLAAAFALIVAFPAHAQLFSDDDARKAILELRQRTEHAVQSELGARLDTAQRNQLDLANQNETLRQEIARLRGQVETLTNEVATLQKRNRDLYTDLDARLKKFEPSTSHRRRSHGHRRAGGAGGLRGGADSVPKRRLQGLDWQLPAVSRAVPVERLRTGSAVFHRQCVFRAQGLQVVDQRQPGHRRSLQGFTARSRGPAVDRRQPAAACGQARQPTAR